MCLSREDMHCTWVDAMDIKILEEKDNKLLERKELKFCVKHEKAATPKKQDLIKELAAKYSVEEDHVVIDYVFTKKGMSLSDVKAKIYKEKPKMKAEKSNVKEPKGEQKK